MENQLISIIIPTYNRASLLPKAVNSVINQTYKNWELIIVDDGSTDNTKEIVRQFSNKDKRIKYFYQENKGQPSAMNVGVKNSQGEFIAFLDDDDEWLPLKLEKQIYKILQDKKIGIVYTNSIVIGQQKRYKINPNKFYYKNNTNFFCSLLKGNLITASSVLLRKECFEKVGLFDESKIIKITQSQDYDMWLRIARYYKIGYMPEVLVKYNYIQKITDWQKRKLAYKAILHIYKKHFNLKNLRSPKCFLILTKSYLKYLFKFIISFFINFLVKERKR